MRSNLRTIAATAVLTLVVASCGFMAGRWALIQWAEYQALREEFWYLRGVTLGHPAKSARAAWSDIEKKRADAVAQAEDRRGEATDAR